MSARPFYASVVGSLFAHALFVFVVGNYLALPDLGVHFQEPIEIEFGVAEDQVAQAPSSVPSQTTPQASESSSGTAGSEGESGAADAGPRRHRDGGVRDAGVGDAGVAADASTDGSTDGGDAGDVDASSQRPTVARATEGQHARLPTGAYVALRFDFQRIRETPLAGSIDELLRTIRDFQAVIGQSGLDPVHDLDQFVMTSRNPWQRRTYMYVGRLSHDEAWARERVAAAAASQGAVAEWTTIDGVETAPWYDADQDVDRVLALLGDRYFILAPANQLATVRTWLDSMAGVSEGPAHRGAALALGVASNEIISLEAENVPAYLREQDREAAPRRARLSIVTADQTYDFSVRADFADETHAVSSAAILDEQLQVLASNDAVRMFGLGRMLSGVNVTAESERLRGRSVLNTADVSLLLSVTSNMLRAHYEDVDARRNANIPPGTTNSAPTP